MTLHRLPSLQPGCREGFRAVGIAFSNANAKGWMKHTDQSNPGDIWGFQWDGAGLGGNPDHMHTERFVKWVTINGQRYGLTIGGNSGPSNVDNYKGNGGVHLHAWLCPVGQGNSLAIGAIDLQKATGCSAADAAAIIKALLASDGYLNGAGYDGANKYSSYLGFSPAAWCGDCQTAAQTLGVDASNPQPAPTPTPAPNNPVQRQIMLTSPFMRGNDVAWVQTRLNKVENDGLTVDGVFGQKSHDAVEKFQGRNGLSVDGIVGAQTSARLASGNARLAAPGATDSVEEPDTLESVGQGLTIPAPAPWPDLEPVTLDPADLADLTA